MTHWLRALWLTTMCCAFACSGAAGTSEDEQANNSSAHTSHSPRTCTGAAGDIPNANCIPANPEDRWPCTEQGATFSGKFVGSMCCAGLEPHTLVEEVPGHVYDGLQGCADNAPPGTFICLACGDGICESTENRCTCPMDCDGQ